MTYLLITIIYAAFISLGLPDSLLGSAWPIMHTELAVPLSYASYISMLMSVGTIISSLMSDRLTRRFGTGRVTAFSVSLTAISLFGYSISDSYIALLLLAIPNGIGAGGVDAALNNYVALNLSGRHMTWLHCMWGVGTVAGPYVMGYVLTRGVSWRSGYGAISAMQVVLVVLLIISLPVWKRCSSTATEASGDSSAPLSTRQVLRLPGARVMIITFFCYCALEITPIVWSGSYLTYTCGFSPESAASFSSMFFIGITLGRAVGGFFADRLSDKFLIRLGGGIVALGVVILLIPFGRYTPLAGLLTLGLGCAPIYPAIMHSTPEYFGRENSGAMIGVQMASAYTGFCLMPPVFGFIADKLGTEILPYAVVILLVLMMCMHERLVKGAAVGFKK